MFPIVPASFLPSKNNAASPIFETALVEAVVEKSAGQEMLGCRTVHKHLPPSERGVPPYGWNVHGGCLTGEWKGRRGEYCGSPSGALSLHWKGEGLSSFAFWAVAQRPPAVLPPSRPLAPDLHVPRSPHLWPRHPPLGEGRVLRHPLHSSAAKESPGHGFIPLEPTNNRYFWLYGVPGSNYNPLRGEQ